MEFTTLFGGFKISMSQSGFKTTRLKKFPIIFKRVGINRAPKHIICAPRNSDH